MKMLNDPITQRPVLTTLLLSGSILLFIRILVVFFWSVLGENGLSESVLIELTLGLLSGLVIASIVAVTIVYYGRNIGNEVSYDAIATAVTTYAVSSLALLLFAGIVPSGIEDNMVLDTVGAVSSNLVAVGVFATSIALAGFLTTLLLMRRHERTRIYLILQGSILVGIWLCAILNDLSVFFDVLGIVFAVIGGIITLMNIRRLNWLSSIGLDKKIRLMWLTACGAFASAVLALFLTFFNEAYITVSTRSFMYSGAALPAAINLFGLLFFVRLFFATMVSLPNSGIVDRRSNEVEALAGLTILVAESASVEELLTSVTKHALSVCRAHGAWCEMYDNGEISIMGEQLVNEPFVHAIHSRPQLHQLISSNSKPVNIDSVSSVVDTGLQLSAVRSLVSIPIVNNSRRIGSLVMFSTLEFGFETDDVRLLTAFGSTVGVSIDQARLLETAIEKERLQKEFDVARDIQLSLLPRHPPIASCCEVDAVTIPATQVGGDYFDFMTFPDGGLGAIIADVSGKGVPAALYMATLKGVVLAESRVATGPADLLNRINETLYGSMGKHTYITMMCVKMDQNGGEVRIARAGHMPAIFRISGTIQVVTPKGVAVGILPPAAFKEHLEEVVIAVSPGDLCLLTTDGVNERRNASMVEMTADPLMEMMSNGAVDSAKELVKQTLHLLNSHGGTTDQHDDITIVGASFTAPSEQQITADGTEAFAGEQQ